MAAGAGACVTPGEVEIIAWGGGGPVACNTASDCGGVDTDCRIRSCIDNTCGFENVEIGTACDDDGGERCDGQGACQSCADGCPEVCGDGVVTGSEPCDRGGDAADCDADCTLVVCGDGHVNVAAGEECEDLNPDSGDGCTPTCSAEGSCDAPEVIELAADASGIFDVQINRFLGGASFLDAAMCDGNAGVGAGPERVYQFELTAQTNLVIELLADFDGAIRLTTAPCDVSTAVNEFGQSPDGCGDSGAASSLESLEVPGLPAGTYYIAVEGVGADDAGEYVLRVATFGGATCEAILSQFSVLESGVYVIDPDGQGVGEPFSAYCDMKGDGGGWTLAARFANSDANSWMADGANYFKSFESKGTPTSPTEVADMISPAFSRVRPRHLRITRTDDANHAHVLMTTGVSCISGNRTFRQFLSFAAQNQDYAGAQGWSYVTNPLFCSAQIDNSSATEGLFFHDCAGTMGGPGRITFFASLGQDQPGAVMLIGGAGGGCGNPDHGIAVSSLSHFDPDPVESADFGDQIPPSTVGYALNLWLR